LGQTVKERLISASKLKMQFASFSVNCPDGLILEIVKKDVLLSLQLNITNRN
jgi:hypothetical protein